MIFYNSFYNYVLFIIYIYIFLDKIIINEKIGKLYYVIEVAKEIDGVPYRFERAINLNGETKEIVKLANYHNLV